MVASGILLFVVAVGVEYANLLRLGAALSRNLVAAVMTSLCAVAMAAVAACQGAASFAVAADWRFWLLVACETASLAAARRAYHANRANLGAVGMAVFATMALIPVVSAAADAAGVFPEALAMDYGSPWGMALFVGVVAGGVTLYFRSAPGRVPDPRSLAVLGACLSATAVVSVKMIQSVNPAALYALVYVAMAGVFLGMSVAKSEWRTACFADLRSGLACAALQMVAAAFGIYASGLFAVEYVSVIKRSAQVGVGMLADAWRAGSWRAVSAPGLAVVIALLSFVAGFRAVVNGV